MENSSNAIIRFCTSPKVNAKSATSSTYNKSMITTFPMTTSSMPSSVTNLTIICYSTNSTIEKIWNSIAHTFITSNLLIDSRNCKHIFTCYLDFFHLGSKDVHEVQAFLKSTKQHYKSSALKWISSINTQKADKIIGGAIVFVKDNLSISSLTGFFNTCTYLWFHSIKLPNVLS